MKNAKNVKKSSLQVLQADGITAIDALTAVTVILKNQEKGKRKKK